MTNNSAATGTNVPLLIRMLEASERQAANDYPGLLRLGDAGCANIITMVVHPLEQAALIMVQHRGHCQSDADWGFARCVSALQANHDIDHVAADELFQAYDHMQAILTDHQCLGRETGGAVMECPVGCVSLPAMPARRAEQLSNCILIARRFRAQLRTQLTGHLA